MQEPLKEMASVLMTQAKSLIQLHWDADFHKCLPVRRQTGTPKAIFSSFGQVYVFKIRNYSAAKNAKYQNKLSVFSNQFSIANLPES